MLCSSRTLLLITLRHSICNHINHHEVQQRLSECGKRVVVYLAAAPLVHPLLLGALPSFFGRDSLVESADSVHFQHRPKTALLGRRRRFDTQLAHDVSVPLRELLTIEGSASVVRVSGPVGLMAVTMAVALSDL